MNVLNMVEHANKRHKVSNPESGFCDWAMEEMKNMDEEDRYHPCEICLARKGAYGDCPFGY